MVHRLSRRTPYWLALLLGVLALAWRPVAAQTALARQDAADLRVAIAVLGDGDGLRSPSHVSNWAPVGHRSPSWHRGTGRRTTRAPGVSPIEPPAGSVPASDPFVRQQVVSFMRSTLPMESTGRSAASPRAPPAVS